MSCELESELDSDECYLISSRAYYLGFDEILIDRPAPEIDGLVFRLETIDTIEYNPTSRLSLWNAWGAEKGCLPVDGEEIWLC